MPPRVYADFQNLDDSDRIRLTCAGTALDLERLGLELREGLTLLLYSDDEDESGSPDELRAEGIVHHDEAHGCWVAVIDWDALHHASEGSANAPSTQNRPFSRENRSALPSKS